MVRSLKRWPVILGIGLLGALAGYIFSLLRPPLYQAEVVLGININYGVTEPLELVVEDRALNRVAAIIESDSTLVRVLSQLPEPLWLERGWSEPADLRKSLRLDRRLAEWELVAIDQDPEVAAIMSQAWAEAVLFVLDEASEHAWRAVALMGENPFLVACVKVPAPEGSLDPFIWDCAIEPVDLDPNALAGALRTELALSHGLLPNISYEVLRDVNVPSKPVVWARGPLILSGAFAGLIVAFWLTVTRDGKLDVPIDNG